MKNTVIKIILFILAAVPVAAQSGGASRGQEAKNEQVRLSALRDIEKYSSDIEKYPDDPDAYLARAKAYVRSGRFEEAIGDLTKAIAVSKHPYYVEW
jgi:thioredoxin-like negative regulator of GroEL